MAEVTKKRKGELQRGVFKILMESPEGLPAKEVLSQLEKSVPPTAFEQGDYESTPGVRRFEKIVRFSTIGPVKAGWLEKTKGRWSLTDAGREAYKKFTDPERFKSEGDRLYRQWADANTDTEQEASEESESENTVSVSFETADEQSWAEIQNYVQNIQPYDFQNKLVTGLLKGMGYHIAHAAPPGPDGGVDVIAYPDPLGTKDPTIKVSVRRRKEQADAKDLREFMSRLHAGEVGIFISINGFSSTAEKECRADSRKVRLLDLEKFFELWVEHYSKIPESDRNLLPIKPVWFLASESMK